jgi:hypothetical protein
MNTYRFPLRCALVLCTLMATLCAPVRAQTNAFTYQGRLMDNGVPAEGLYDFVSQLYDKSGPPGDVQTGPTLTNSSVPVRNGLFTLRLDFGPGIFTGQARRLALGVRLNGGGGFTALTPRQEITTAPYAQFAFAGNQGPEGPPGPAGSPGPAGPAGDSHWLLNGSSTYYNAGNVGIGTSTPGWPLQVVSGQGVIRLDSTSSGFGSVLELRNNAAAPTYLGALNFNNAAGTYPGQIGYLATHDLVFRTANAEHMRLSGEGRLDVPAANSTVAVNVVDTILNIPFPRGIRTVSDGVLSTALSAYSELGTAVSAGSAGGWAANFSGAESVLYASPFDKPQLALKDPSDNGFSRLRFQTGTRPLWDLALGTSPGATNTLRFFSEGNGDVVTISPQGNLSTRVLTITGGADISEPFDMSEHNLPKGAVVIIDEDAPGQLKLSVQPYDRRVAGVISGAGGVNPGLSLSQQGVLSGGQQVALTGRVYVQADASSGAIKPGDLLTTSDTPGHAMKVTDFSRAPGSVLGKAMTGLKEGKGLVLVLVSLQ